MGSSSFGDDIEYRNGEEEKESKQEYCPTVAKCCHSGFCFRFRVGYGPPYPQSPFIIMFLGIMYNSDILGHETTGVSNFM